MGNEELLLRIRKLILSLFDSEEYVISNKALMELLDDLSQRLIWAARDENIEQILNNWENEVIEFREKMIISSQENPIQLRNDHLLLLDEVKVRDILFEKPPNPEWED